MTTQRSLSTCVLRFVFSICRKHSTSTKNPDEIC